MSRVEIEKLMYQKPSLTPSMNALLKVHGMGGQDEPIEEPISGSGTGSQETNDLDPTTSPTPEP